MKTHPSSLPAPCLKRTILVSGRPFDGSATWTEPSPWLYYPFFDTTHSKATLGKSQQPWLIGEKPETHLESEAHHKVKHTYKPGSWCQSPEISGYRDKHVTTWADREWIRKNASSETIHQVGLHSCDRWEWCDYACWSESKSIWPWWYGSDASTEKGSTVWYVLKHVFARQCKTHKVDLWESFVFDDHAKKLWCECQQFGRWLAGVIDCWQTLEWWVVSWLSIFDWPVEIEEFSSLESDQAFQPKHLFYVCARGACCRVESFN